MVFRRKYNNDEKKGYGRLRYGAEEEIWEELQTEPRGARKPEKKKGAKLVLRVLLIVSAAALAVMLWMSRDSLTAQNIGDWFHTRLVGIGVGDGYPVSISGTRVLPTNLRSDEGMAVSLSDTSLTLINPTGKVVMSRQHSFSEPRLCMAGGRYLVYNLGGTGCRVENTSKTVYTITADGKIQSAALAAGGRCALVTQAYGNASRLTVYMENGAVQYIYSFYDAYITAVALDRTGSHGIVSTVSTEGGALCSKLYLFDFSKEEPVASYSAGDNLILFLHWSEDGTVAAVGDLAALYGTADTLSQGQMTSYAYNGAELSAYTFERNRVVLALYDSADSTVVCIGGETGPLAVSLPGQAVSCSVFGHSVGVLCGSSVTVLDAVTGETLACTQVERDAKALALSGESTAYVLGVNEIRTLDLKESEPPKS